MNCETRTYKLKLDVAARQLNSSGCEFNSKPINPFAAFAKLTIEVKAMKVNGAKATPAFLEEHVDFSGCEILVQDRDVGCRHEFDKEKCLANGGLWHFDDASESRKSIVQLSTSMPPHIVC